MPNMDDRELIAIVDQEFSQSMGAPGGEISTERAKAWNYYMSKPLGNEVEGKSQVVTSDVADVVDGIMPSLLRIFTTAENLVSFDPVGPEDIEKAEQESDYVNYVFFKQNPAFYLLYTWFFDALVQKNGIVMAWWDESEVVTTESYKGLSEAEVSELLDDDELEPVEREEEIADSVGEDGVTIEPMVVHNITFRRVSKRGQARVENVPPEEYRVSADTRTLDPCSGRMVGRERDVTRSELIDMGIDSEVVADLSTSGEFMGDNEEIARYNKTDENSDSPKDPSQQKVTVQDCYIKVDYDGDGRAELRRVMTSGNKVLINEPADRQPFHVLCPQPLPHKHFGRSSADKVMDILDINSTLLRQVLDNLYQTNNPGHAVWEQGIGENTLDDLLTTRVGSIKRFARPVSESYAPMTVPFTAAASFPMVEYFDRVKRDRTGISSDGDGLDPDALKNIQQSVMAQANDLGRMKVEAVARIFAETGIKSLFLHIHELLLKHQDKAQLVRLREQFVQVDPQEWRTRMDMTVNVGLGIGSRETNLMHLEAIWAKQSAMLEGGGMNLTVTPRNFFNTAAEIVKNANFKAPSMFFTDPGDQQAPPPSDEMQELQRQQQEIQERQQQLDAQDNAIKEARLAQEREKTQLQHEREMMELERKRDADADNLAIEMEKIRTKMLEIEMKEGQSGG